MSRSTDFDLQPVLTGHLVQLRPLRETDFQELYRAASDPLIWAQHPEPDRCKPEVFQRFFGEAIRSNGGFAVLQRETGKIIGSSRYYDHDAGERQVMIGFTFVEREFWGKGHNTEMKALMLDHAFRFVDRVLFQVGAQNLRSQKALQKIGAQILSRVELPSSDGSSRPHVVFVLTRELHRTAQR